MTGPTDLFDAALRDAASAPTGSKFRAWRTAALVGARTPDLDPGYIDDRLRLLAAELGIDVERARLTLADLPVETARHRAAARWGMTG